MNKTPNYQLNQWEAGDKVQHQDFNADNAKIDAAIAALSARVTDLVFGSYTGDGAASRTIGLGRTPKAVLVLQQNGLTYYSYSRVLLYGGLALAGMPLKHGSTEALKVVDGGFWVSYLHPSGDDPAAMTNINGNSYYYIAMF